MSGGLKFGCRRNWLVLLRWRSPTRRRHRPCSRHIPRSASSVRLALSWRTMQQTRHRANSHTRPDDVGLVEPWGLPRPIWLKLPFRPSIGVATAFLLATGNETCELATRGVNRPTIKGFAIVTSSGPSSLNEMSAGDPQVARRSRGQSLHSRTPAPTPCRSSARSAAGQG
jgi:hypothetical protein